MASYALKSSYEFTESPKNSPQKQSRPSTPAQTEKSNGIGSFFSMKWGSFTAKASQVAQKARGAINGISASSPSTSVESIDYNLDLAYAPWENLCPHDEKADTELRQLILSVPSQPRHLLNAPPPDEFQFNFEEWIPVALAGLWKDALLREARSALVPTEIDEETFWRNYFFRVTLLKRAFAVPEHPQLKDGATLPKPSSLRQSLASSASSIGQRDSTDLNASSSSGHLSNFEEPDLDGLIQEPDTSQTDANSESLLVPSSIDQSALLGQESIENGFYDPDDETSWHMHRDYGDGIRVQTKTPVSDEILKALED